MATIFKRPNSPFWQVAWLDPNGKRRWRSTKTVDRKQAEQTAATFDKALALGLAKKLTPDKAHQVLKEGLEEVFLAVNREALPSSTVRDWCTQWLSAKEIETESATHERYAGILKRFYEFLGPRADKDIGLLRTEDISKFRNALAKDLSVASANLAVKTLRAAMAAAYREQLVERNVAAAVDVIETTTESKRRPFTVAEIQTLLTKAGDTELRGLIVFGLFGGLRLGDIARLRWDNVDLEEKELTFTVKKTGRRQTIPIAPPLVNYLVETLSAPDNPNTPLFPKAAALAKNKVSMLSNQFHELLVQCGLATKQSKEATGEGRNKARTTNELSFHSLRHSFVSALKAAGVGEAVAMALAGHSSAAISRAYTKIPAEVLAAAVAKLPDVTKGKV